jgi:hypothetical protein
MNFRGKFFYCFEKLIWLVEKLIWLVTKLVWWTCQLIIFIALFLGPYAWPAEKLIFLLLLFGIAIFVVVAGLTVTLRFVWRQYTGAWIYNEQTYRLVLRELSHIREELDEASKTNDLRRAQIIIDAKRKDLGNVSSLLLAIRPSVVLNTLFEQECEHLKRAEIRVRNRGKRAHFIGRHS